MLRSRIQTGLVAAARDARAVRAVPSVARVAQVARINTAARVPRAAAAAMVPSSKYRQAALMQSVQAVLQASGAGENGV